MYPGPVSDEALRELEREVATTNGTEARVRLAQALERAGREVEAWEAIAPAAREPEAWAFLSSTPVWTGRWADPRWLDVAPVSSEPTSSRLVAPSVRGDDAHERFDQRFLWAGPDRLVIERTRASYPAPDRHRRIHRETVVLDPTTGAELHALGEGVVGVIPGALVGRDARWVEAGDRLAARPLRTRRGRTRFEATDPDGLCLAVHEDAGTRQLVAFRFTARGKQAEWSVELDPAWVPGALSIGSRLVLEHSSRDRRLRVLDRHTGAELWASEWEGARCLHQGEDTFGCATRLERALEAIGPDGSVRWTVEGCSAIACGPSFVLARQQPGDALVSLEREGGAHRAVIAAGCEPELPVAAAREVVYWVRGTSKVCASTLDGERLWAMRFGPPRVVDLAVGPERVWVACADGSVHLLRARDHSAR